MEKQHDPVPDFLADYKPDQMMFTVREVAAILGVSQQGVYKWVYDGLLPAMHLGKGTVRISRRALLDFPRVAPWTRS